MKLNLKRPLAFFDIESTGTNVALDRIVELSVIKLNPDGSEEVKTWRINPGMPIPLESSIVHGIYDEHSLIAPPAHLYAHYKLDGPGITEVAEAFLDS